jgi:hypothetical protein
VHRAETRQSIDEEKLPRHPVSDTAGEHRAPDDRHLGTNRLVKVESLDREVQRVLNDKLRPQGSIPLWDGKTAHPLIPGVIAGGSGTVVAAVARSGGETILAAARNNELVSAGMP